MMEEQRKKELCREFNVRYDDNPNFDITPVAFAIMDKLSDMDAKLTTALMQLSELRK